MNGQSSFTYSRHISTVPSRHSGSAFGYPAVGCERLTNCTTNEKFSLSNDCVINRVSIISCTEPIRIHIWWLMRLNLSSQASQLRRGGALPLDAPLMDPRTRFKVAEQRLIFPVQHEGVIDDLAASTSMLDECLRCRCFHASPILVAFMLLKGVSCVITRCTCIRSVERQPSSDLGNVHPLK